LPRLANRPPMGIRQQYQYPLLLTPLCAQGGDSSGAGSVEAGAGILETNGSLRADPPDIHGTFLPPELEGGLPREVREHLGEPPALER
jgi:hypothetical protein